MQYFYDNITVNGEVIATKLSGELSEQTRAVIDNQLSVLMNRLQAAETALEKVTANNCMLVEKYNTAIEVINNLSERIVALESNYDPTVIGNVPSAIKKQGE